VRLKRRAHGLAGTKVKDHFPGRCEVVGTSHPEVESSSAGLGLALVKHIVEAHRGKITVDSEPAHGSTFTLHLPVVREEDAAILPTNLSGPATAGVS
jgi:hypothetical protein